MEFLIFGLWKMVKAYILRSESYLCFLMVESRPHCSHYLTEALQILPHILELDSLLLFQ